MATWKRKSSGTSLRVNGFGESVTHAPMTRAG